MENKIIVVIGGAGFIGQVFAREIAKQGGLVISSDINFEVSNSSPAVINNQSFGKIEKVKLDITNRESINSLISDINLRYGRIDAVINSAYPRNEAYGKKLEDVTYLDFCENVNLHLGGYFLVSQQFCLAFRKQGGGNLINISSIYGSVAPRFDLYEDTSMTMPVEYAAVKSAIVQLTRYFAQFYKTYGIRVNCLSPGGVFANQPKSFVQGYGKYCGSKGMLDPDDLVGTLMYLLSDSSRYVTGQNIIVDDGFTL